MRKGGEKVNVALVRLNLSRLKRQFIKKAVSMDYSGSKNYSKLRTTYFDKPLLLKFVDFLSTATLVALNNNSIYLLYHGFRKIMLRNC